MSKTFISWSGKRSNKIAEELKSFLDVVVQKANTFLSSRDIDSGAMWQSKILDELRFSSFGIFCLTSENSKKPWILFEAGAVCKGEDNNRVCCLLIDLDTDEVERPLAIFQNRKLFDKDDFFKLINSINDSLGDDKLPSYSLKKAFDNGYNDFEAACQKIISDTEEVVSIKKRSESELLEELLSLSKAGERIDINIHNAVMQIQEYIKETSAKSLSKLSDENTQKPLVIVSGTYGPWKAVLLDDLTEISDDFVFINKYTDLAKPENNEYALKLNLIFDCNIKEKNCKYRYRYFGHSYGISNDDIDNALKSEKTPIIVISDDNIIAKLKRDYSNVKMMYIHCFSNPNYISYLKEKKYGQETTPEKIEEREMYNIMLLKKCIEKNLIDYFEYYYFSEQEQNNLLCIKRLESIFMEARGGWHA